MPPLCEGGLSLRRRRRAVENATVTDLETDEPVIEVFSGLYVNEGEEVPEDDPNGPLSRVCMCTPSTTYSPECEHV